MTTVAMIPPPPDDATLMTPHALAELAGVSIATAWRWIRERRIAAIRLHPRRIAVSRASAEEYLARRRQRSADDAAV